jgi:hypothetical protein
MLAFHRLSRCLFLQIGRLIFFNLFLHISWSLKSLDPYEPDESSMASLLATRARFMQHLYTAMDSVLDNYEQGHAQNSLSCTVSILLTVILPETFSTKWGPRRLYMGHRERLSWHC